MELNTNYRDKSGSILQRSYTRKGPGRIPYRENPAAQKWSTNSLSTAMMRSTSSAAIGSRRSTCENHT